MFKTYAFRKYTKTFFGLSAALALATFYLNFSTGTDGFHAWDTRGQENFGSSDSVPFSFDYDKTPFSATKWNKVAATDTNATYRDPSNTVEVQFVQKSMADFGAVKWVLMFKNISIRNNSAVISNVKSANVQLINDRGVSSCYTINYGGGSTRRKER